MNQRNSLILLVVIIAIGIVVSVYNSVAKSSPVVLPTATNTGSILPNQDKFGTNSADLSPVVTIEPTRAVKQYSKFPGILTPSKLKNKKAVIQTNKGKIEFEIYPEASKAASNFIFLAQDGFYNNLTFHRVEPGFVIQGGDPLGNGSGGPGYTFEDEPMTRSYDQGIVAMANSGPNTNGSQFFIMLKDRPDLPAKYTIFGKVIAGIDVVEKIAVGDIMKQVSIVSFVKPPTPTATKIPLTPTVPQKSVTPTITLTPTPNP